MLLDFLDSRSAHRKTTAHKFTHITKPRDVDKHGFRQGQFSKKLKKKKESVVAYFEVLPGGTEGTHEV
jgi:hypothetical protein